MKEYIFQILNAFLLIIPLGLNAQILNSNGANIYVNNGGILHCNGGITISNNSTLTNEGTIRSTKNASNTLAGTLTNRTSSSISGNGDYYIEQDWINDATFNANGSSVYLYGNSEQFITSTNGTITEFNN